MPLEPPWRKHSQQAPLPSAKAATVQLPFGNSLSPISTPSQRPEPDPTCPTPQSLGSPAGSPGTQLDIATPDLADQALGNNVPHSVQHLNEVFNTAFAKALERLDQSLVPTTIPTAENLADCETAPIVPLNSSQASQLYKWSDEFRTGLRYVNAMLECGNYPTSRTTKTTTGGLGQAGKWAHMLGLLEAHSHAEALEFCQWEVKPIFADFKAKRHAIPSEIAALEEQSQDPSGAGSWNQLGKKGSAWGQLKRSNHEDSVGTNRGYSGGDASWSSSSWGDYKRQKWSEDTQ